MRLASSLFACLAAVGSTLAVAAIMTGAGLETHPASAAQPPSAAIATAIPAVPVAGFGTIKGKLVWGGAEVPKAAEIQKNKDIAYCKDFDLVKNGMPVDPSTKGVGSAFAYVLKPKGKNPAAEKALLEKSPEVVIDNKNCEFVPYSTAAFKDQTVVFASDDPVVHNSHVTGFSQGKNVVLAPKGKDKGKLQVESRPINLSCDIHPWMEGKIMVFDHPFFAVTAPDGSFEITGVPEGEQMLVVRLSDGIFITPSAGKAVAVKAGETTDAGQFVVDPAKVKK